MLVYYLRLFNKISLNEVFLYENDVETYILGLISLLPSHYFPFILKKLIQTLKTPNPSILSLTLHFLLFKQAVKVSCVPCGGSEWVYSQPKGAKVVSKIKDKGIGVQRNVFSLEIILQVI
jgi:hypothetical protein